MSADVNKKALTYVRENWRNLVVNYCNLDEYPPVPKPVTIFMAGCPGVGKTEYSRGLVKQLEIQFYPEKFIRLDVDELREIMPGYVGTNSDEVQPACSKLFTKIYDHIRHNNQHAVIDGTFSGKGSVENVRVALERGRSVGITYLYQDPFIAWEYAKKREKLEGRTVSKDYFISAFLDSIDMVNKVKEEFEQKITLDVSIKNGDNDFVKKSHFNVPSLKGYIKHTFAADFLQRNLPNVI